MKMTIAEALSIPVGMKFDEYEKLLEEKKKLFAKIRKLSITIQDEEDSLEMLSDEVGSERYNRHLAAKQKAEAGRAKAEAKYEALEAKLR